ncbi:testis-expressed protein 11-like [Zophobas morio]|uniref:testis-expressed protein 11-like n=1 Tax=Zophobas morio TaxID=2755281 RepID=UPI003082F051
MAEELIMKVQELLNNTAFVFPEIEVQWLLTKAWNTGVQFYSSLEFKLAESWCRLALSLVENLKTLKHNYQDQLNTYFAKIINAKFEV